jgi:hypothetical protein
MKGDLIQKSKQQLKRVSETFSFLGTDRQPLAARLLWVKRRNTRSEKMTSALAPTTGIQRLLRHVRFAPAADLCSAVQSMRRFWFDPVFADEGESSGR